MGKKDEQGDEEDKEEIKIKLWNNESSKKYFIIEAYICIAKEVFIIEAPVI